MPLQGPYTVPSGANFASAYVWISRMEIDFATGFARIYLSLHPTGTLASAGKPAVEHLIFDAGNPQSIPDLAAIEAANQTHFAGLQNYLEQQLLKLPNFTGFSQVP